MAESSSLIYSIGAVARLTKLTPTTIRTWERRYKLVSPARSEGGQRLYTRDQAEQLRFVKSKVDAGESPSTAHRMLAEALMEGRVSLSKPERSDRPILLILLAERDRFASEFEEYFLRTEGYQVELVFDVEEAESKAKELVPDLIIVELLISGGAGLDLCRRLKARGLGPVLAISALAVRDVALAAGADAFLCKPLDGLQLVSAARDLLGDSAFLGERAT